MERPCEIFLCAIFGLLLLIPIYPTGAKSVVQDDSEPITNLVYDGSSERMLGDPDGLGPFSILGILSFGTLILSVFLSHYKLKGKKLPLPLPLATSAPMMT